jgi:hypothetical protein
MNHLVGDGYSFFYLLSVLAATTKQAGKPFVPAIIRAFSRPKLKSSLHAKFHFSEKTREIDSSYEDLIVEVMEVGQSETREQAKKITEKIGMRISTNDMLCAQLLKLILQSKKQISGNRINLVIPVDMRRAAPELGQRFFGNGLILHRVSFDKKEVAKKEVEALAIKIREHFPKRDVKKYKEFLQSIENKINAKNLANLQLYDPEKEFLVTNLTRMPITRLDFGSGLPEIIVPLTRGRSGAAILAQNDKFILQLGR